MAPERTSAANTLFSMMQQLGLGLGIALGAIAVRIGQALASGPLAPFAVAFSIVGALTLLSLLDSLRLAHDAGAAISGHRLAAGPAR